MHIKQPFTCWMAAYGLMCQPALFHIYSRSIQYTSLGFPEDGLFWPCCLPVFSSFTANNSYSTRPASLFIVTSQSTRQEQAKQGFSCTITIVIELKTQGQSEWPSPINQRLPSRAFQMRGAASQHRQNFTTLRSFTSLLPPSAIGSFSNFNSIFGKKPSCQYR